jgi:hypothetical protein
MFLRCFSQSPVFQVRHILVHEVPSTKPCTSDEIEDFFNAVTELITAADEIWEFELHGLVPLTQVEMNIAAGEEFAAQKSRYAAN